MKDWPKCIDDVVTEIIHGEPEIIECNKYSPVDYSENKVTWNDR